MDQMELKNQWQSEEEYSFQGWDFSHIEGRWESIPLPWDYARIVNTYRKNTDRMLDMGTGGGEFLLTLGHPHPLTAVTEAYPPNVALCQRTLSPLGIMVEQIYEDDQIPYQDEQFDLVINRHESFDPMEINRVLRRGGYFITQQVGNKNDNDLSYRLIDGFVPPFPKHELKRYVKIFEELGYEILLENEFFSPIRFFDVGALAYFAKVIEWEFPDFTVETCFDRLLAMQKDIDEQGYIEGTEHRFMLVVKKR